MKKKILFITSRPLEAKVSSSIRKISTLNSLLKAGAEVTVVTTRYQKAALNFSPVNLPDNVKVIRIGTSNFYKASIDNYSFKEGKNSMRKIVLSKIRYILRNIYYYSRIYDPLKSSIKYVNELKGKLDEEYDIIISLSDPKSSHLMSNEILKRGITSTNKYYQIWGDPLYLDITRKTILPRTLLKKEEKRLINNADRIYYVSPLTLIRQRDLFPDYKDKMSILAPTYSEAVSYKNAKAVTVLGYFGDYNSEIRNIEPLYQAIKNSNYSLNICGNSDLKLSSYPNISIQKRLPFAEVKELEKEVDLLVFLSNKRGTQIPSKIYQYLGTNKPILFILDGEEKEELKKIFEKYNRVIFSENDTDSILKNLDLYNSGQITVELKPIEEYKEETVAKKLLN